jgi:hypothetical protein
MNLRRLSRLLPERLKRPLRLVQGFEAGRSFAVSLQSPPPSQAFANKREITNPLWDYFSTHKTGPGIWKWNHYFEIYHRHLQKFRGCDVRVLEIGVFSGGSLGMWREYFGPKSIIYGVDIEPACQCYENDWTKIFIGDQGDRGFWRKFKKDVQQLHVVIDDGSHIVDHQITSFVELFPALMPGGVYICEDVHTEGNRFASFISGLADALNSTHAQYDSENPERCLSTKATGAQAAVNSISQYPFVVVVEKRSAIVTEFVAPKHGTQWQPFLGGGR